MTSIEVAQTWWRLVLPVLIVLLAVGRTASAAEKQPESVIYKKIAGSIYGGAIGDAMGGPVEMKPKEYVDQWFGGRVDKIEKYRSEDGKEIPGSQGRYTDDTTLRLILCRAIIDKQGRVDAQDFARAWLKWFEPDRLWVTEHIAYGKMKVYSPFWSNLPLPGIFADPNYSARDAGKGNIPACNAAMMVPPIGLIDACNPFQAALDGYEVSLTCQSGYSASASCAVAAAVAEAMKRDATVEGIVDAAIEHTDWATAYCIRRAVVLAAQCDGTAEFTRLFYEKDYLYSPVDVLEVVPAAIGLFLAAKGDFKETILGGVNFGRDCDTIPGIAGSIAGAFHSIDAIPGDWIRTVRDANPEPDLDEIILGMYKALGAELLSAERRTREIRKIY